jgi:uncharacterized FlaG/YvyC family protein
MSIYFNRGQTGQVGKGGLSGQAPSNPRGSPSDDANSSADTSETSAAENELFSTTSAASESGLQATIMSAPADPIHVKRAVKEANKLAESKFSTGDRSVEFGLHQPSGRITITIREELNGSTIEREIPPKAFLKLYERLKDAEVNQSSETPKGALIDLDG